MLKKINTGIMVFTDKMGNETEKKIMRGTICGANIKPFKFKENKLKKTINLSKDKKEIELTKHWGVFIYIRMEDGIQYLAVFGLTKTMETILDADDSNIYCGKRKSKKREVPEFSIPEILKYCGVDEWIELIGTDVTVTSFGEKYPPNNRFMFKGVNAKCEVFPSYFGIEPQYESKFKLSLDS